MSRGPGRPNITQLDESALNIGSSANLSRRSTSNNAYAYGAQPQRTPSPPASAYFPLLSSDLREGLRPTPDAESHFAYSTTLRRHHVDSPGFRKEVEREALSLWARFKRAFVPGQQKSDAEEEEGLLPEDDQTKPDIDETAHRDTPSALHAHLDTETSLSHFPHTTLTNGLAQSALSELRKEYGYNEFSVGTPEPLWLKFAKTIYESPLILLLCGSAVVSGVMGNLDDAISISIAVLIVLTVGFVQEQRSEKSLEALNKLVPHHTRVIRDGQMVHVLANELLPGDLVLLEMGDRVPADLRMVEATAVEIDESSLTGEGDPRVKSTNACQYPGSGREPAPLAERHSVAYMGTLVRSGRGKGIVIATGAKTEFGVIFSMMQDVEAKRTPLQLSMDSLAHKLSMISFGIIGFIMVIGVFVQGKHWLDMFTIGVSLAVAAIPEGLPIVTTVTLALGVLRMSSRQAIVKKLHSVEALGSVSVICSDKTGTLTKNEMSVRGIWGVDEWLEVDDDGNTRTPTKAHHKALLVGSVCNNTSLEKNAEGFYAGQSTDIALVSILDTLAIPDVRKAFTRTAEKPFSSEWKYMAIVGSHSSSPTLPASLEGREVIYLKGAIEAVLAHCKFYYVSEDSTPALDDTTRGIILARAKEAMSRGMRVLGMAWGFADRYSSDGVASDDIIDSRLKNKNLVFTGFQAMTDPPRKGVSDSIAVLQRGGVRVVMITGDAEDTAVSIARSLGLNVGGAGAAPARTVGTHGRNGSIGASSAVPAAELAANSPFVMTGTQLDTLTPAQLVARVANVSVFARTTPRHKMKIVEALQKRGEVVSMTGDGVNDAPALKLADVGVCMGRSGTDVAKEASDVILVDDNFATILGAVEEGKSIFHNIQNFLSFQLSTAAAALTLITLSTMLGLSNPLNAMQILFINILMDGPPSQSLGVDPVDPSIMGKPPRKKDSPIITRRLLYRVLFSASLIVCGTLFIYLFALSDDHVSRREQTMTFTAFVTLDLVSAIQNRSISCGITQNRMLCTTVSVSYFTQLCLVYVPFMQKVFQTDALDLSDLAIILGLGAISFVLHEARRGYERKLDSETSRVDEMA